MKKNENELVGLLLKLRRRLHTNILMWKKISRKWDLIYFECNGKVN